MYLDLEQPSLLQAFADDAAFHLQSRLGPRGSLVLDQVQSVPALLAVLLNDAIR